MSLSKHIVDGTCAQIAHPWTPGCLDAYRSIINESATGSLKLLMPLLFINYGVRIWKKKKPNDTLPRDLLIDIIRCLGLGPCMSTSSLFFNCVLRYILGRYTYVTLAFMPAVLSGLVSVSVLGLKLRTQILVPTSNAALESIVKHWSATTSRPLTLNRYTETLFFMFTNACLMYASKLARSSYAGYTWFFKPDKKCRDQDIKLFLESTFKKMRYYFGLGLGYGFFRTLITDISVLKSKNMHKIFNISTLRPGIFAGTYVVLYETIVYALNRYFQQDRSVYALPAGFLAGLSYAIDPNLPINVSSFINLIQILYYLADIQLLRPPLMESIMFSLCYATILHIELLYPKDAAKLGFRMIKLCSGTKFLHAFEAVRKHIIYVV